MNSSGLTDEEMKDVALLQLFTILPNLEIINLSNQDLSDFFLT